MLHPRCHEQTTLTDTEITYLQELPEPALEVEPELPCELEADHPGPHMAIGQSYGPG